MYIIHALEVYGKISITFSLITYLSQSLCLLTRLILKIFKKCHLLTLLSILLSYSLLLLLLLYIFLVYTKFTKLFT